MAGAGEAGWERSHEMYSPFDEREALMAEVHELRNALDTSKEETARVSNQLNCIMSLVKQAWQGDKEAVVHLSQITGAEALLQLNVNRSRTPDANEEMRNTNRKEKQIRAVKNWAILVAKMLHKKYNVMMNRLRDESLMKLNQRSTYFDELLEREKSAGGNKENHRLTKRRVNSAGHLPTGHPPAGDERVLGVDDLFRLTAGGDGAPNSLVHNAMANLSRSKVDQTEKHRLSGDSESEKFTSYDDPQRYGKPGLYDVSPFVKKPPPVDGASLKDGDVKRARPKSSHVIGRPLKYETTIPTHLDKPKIHPKISRPTSANIQKNTSTPTAVDHEQTTPLAKTTPAQKLAEDLCKMNELEKGFRQATLTLQKKIGIRPEGFVNKK